MKTPFGVGLPVDRGPVTGACPSSAEEGMKIDSPTAIPFILKELLRDQGDLTGSWSPAYNGSTSPAVEFSAGLISLGAKGFRRDYQG